MSLSFLRGGPRVLWQRMVLNHQMTRWTRWPVNAVQRQPSEQNIVQRQQNILQRKQNILKRQHWKKIQLASHCLQVQGTVCMLQFFLKKAEEFASL